MNPGLSFEMTKFFAALLFIAVIPFIIADIFRGSISLTFWQIVGSTFGIALSLFAVLEYKLNKG